MPAVRSHGRVAPRFRLSALAFGGRGRGPRPFPSQSRGCTSFHITEPQTLSSAPGHRGASKPHTRPRSEAHRQSASHSCESKPFDHQANAFSAQAAPRPVRVPASRHGGRHRLDRQRQELQRRLGRRGHRERRGRDRRRAGARARPPAFEALHAAGSACSPPAVATPPQRTRIGRGVWMGGTEHLRRGVMPGAWGGSAACAAPSVPVAAVKACGAGEPALPPCGAPPCRMEGAEGR